jgi:hypothetical protein
LFFFSVQEINVSYGSGLLAVVAALRYDVMGCGCNIATRSTMQGLVTINPITRLSNTVIYLKVWQSAAGTLFFFLLLLLLSSDV